MLEFRKGARLGLDYGQARIGVARSDIDGIMAIPVMTIKRHNGSDCIKEILNLIEEYNIFEVIVGMPVHLNGKAGISANLAKKFALKLAKAKPELSVRMLDERLTTVSAHANLLQAGVDRRKHKSLVDQVAAVQILENALEYEKKNAKPAGVLLHPEGK